MCDWEDFDDEGFEDGFEESMDDLDDPDDDLSADAEDEAEEDAFAAGEAFFLGGAMGLAYEEGLEERRRMRLLQKGKKRKKPDDLEW